MNIISTIIFTLLIGPVAFWVITRVTKTNAQFPVSTTGAIGDTVFLPLFNGLAVYSGILTVLLFDDSILTISVISTIIFSTVYLIYRKNSSVDNNWMRNKKGSFNIAGWYHFAYVVVQLFFIFVTLLHFPTLIWLWLTLLGYVVVVIFARR